MSKRAMTILVVEDSDDHLYIMKHTFRKAGLPFAIEAARDGDEARRLLLSDDGEPLRPHLIIMDISLPKLGGLELLDILRKDSRTADIPVIMTSTTLNEEEWRESIERGASCYLPKPLAIDDLLAHLEKLGLYCP